MLKGLFEERELTIRDVARRLRGNVSEDVVSNWVRGRTRVPPEKRVELASLLNVPESDLRFPKPSSRLLSLSIGNESSGEFPQPIVRVGVRSIPIYGALLEGMMVYRSIDVIGQEEIPDWGTEAERYGRVVNGHELEPEFEDQDIVVFEKRVFEDGHVVHAFTPNGDVIRILRKNPISSKLVSMNGSSDPIETSECSLEGVLVARIRRGKGYREVRDYIGGFRSHEKA